MKVLLLGADGMLAQDLAAHAPVGVQLTCRTRPDLDVTNHEALRRDILAIRPRIVINAAAYSAVDRAEEEPERAKAVNGAAPGVIGTAAAEARAFVIHYSTDYVFDETRHRPIAEDDAPAPLSVYAASKLEGERSLAASGAEYLIIRSQWLFGVHGRSFPRTMWHRARAGHQTRVVNDQFGRPTYTVDLAEATWRILAKVKAGRGAGVAASQPPVIHIANSGIATWFDVARHVFRAAQAEDLLAPCSTAEYPTPARRPAWSVLDTTRYETLAGCPLPTWRDGLDRFLRELGGGSEKR